MCHRIDKYAVAPNQRVFYKIVDQNYKSIHGSGNGSRNLEYAIGTVVKATNLSRGHTKRGGAESKAGIYVFGTLHAALRHLSSYWSPFKILEVTANKSDWLTTSLGRDVHTFKKVKVLREVKSR